MCLFFCKNVPNQCQSNKMNKIGRETDVKENNHNSTPRTEQYRSNKSQRNYAYVVNIRFFSLRIKWLVWILFSSPIVHSFLHNFIRLERKNIFIYSLFLHS